MPLRSMALERQQWRSRGWMDDGYGYDTDPDV
jgi:hypothetical protein